MAVVREDGNPVTLANAFLQKEIGYLIASRINFPEAEFAVFIDDRRLLGGNLTPFLYPISDVH